MNIHPCHNHLLELRGNTPVPKGSQQEGAHVLGTPLDKCQSGRLPQQRGQPAAGHKIVGQLRMAKRGIITTGAVDQLMTFPPFQTFH